MWIFNGKALIAVAIGVVGGIAVAAATKMQAVSAIAAILVAMGVDVWMRFHSEDCEHPLIDPNAGGHVWFAPIWFAGIVLMILLGLSHFRII
ncbi:MAG: hypothetical protein JWP89_222 [Schlesneria sp.]|nr:hypothetical protein [Schlesneria sp.]